MSGRIWPSSKLTASAKIGGVGNLTGGLKEAEEDAVVRRVLVPPMSIRRNIIIV